MRYARILGLSATFTLIAPTALAQPVTLAEGAVVCLTQRDARHYAAWHLTAPRFAADLLDRASCVVLRDETTALQRDRSTPSFPAFHLLEGHQVWLAVVQDVILPAQP